MKAPVNKDTSNPLTFDKSNTGSLPANMINGYQTYRVENVLNTVTGEYSNVGAFDTVRGRNEKVGITMETINSQSSVVFETDFMIKSAEDELMTQFFLTNSKNEPKGNSAFGMIFVKSGSGFVIT